MTETTEETDVGVIGVDFEVDRHPRPTIASELTLFRADWTDAMFIHFAVPPKLLRPHVPAAFELDTLDGMAYVSLVAFTQRNLHPAVGGRLAKVLATPLAEHAFLNLRTYVRFGGETGIHFLAEWIPNRLAILIGPRSYGLPYRFARMNYRRDIRSGALNGDISAPEGIIKFEERQSLSQENRHKESTKTLDHFLLERYTAWTHRAGVIRRFRIAHYPWQQTRVAAHFADRSLLDVAAPWMRGIDQVGANVSSGVFDVAIGRPMREHTECGKYAILRRSWTDFAPLMGLPIVALAARDLLPAWIFMWILAASIFAGCKWLTLVDALRGGMRISRVRQLCYLFAWVGMDARSWLKRSEPPVQIDRGEAVRAIFNIAAGATLIFGLARYLGQVPYVAGCIGASGVVLVLHFGVFHLLAIAWRAGGVNAEPLMNRPITATSVGDFWGRRWNRGFNALAERYIFRPLSRKVGPRAALLATFAMSGIVHDLVISVPARGGYGLPTLYFVIQGMAVLFERPLRRRPIIARTFTIVVVALPAPLLLHPPFVLGVIVPMLRAIGAM